MKGFTFLVILFFFFILVNTQYSSTYSCDSSISDPICATKTKITETTYSYKLGLCQTHNYICDLEQLEREYTGTCKDFANVDRLYSGETCTKNAECISNKCEQEICQGKPEDSECAFDHDCDLGLYCYHNKCIKFLNKGNTEPCGIDTNSKICDPNLACADSKCVELGSLPNGAIADEIWACESGFTFFDSNDRQFHCTDGDILKDTTGNLTVCPPEDKCTYELVYKGQKIETTTSCQCGMRPTSNMICPLGKGELYNDFKTTINYVKKYEPQCPIDRRFFCAKEPYNNEYFKALISYQRYYLGEDQIFENDECTKFVYNSYYWTSFDIIKKKEKYTNIHFPSSGFTSFLTNDQY